MGSKDFNFSRRAIFAEIWPFEVEIPVQAIFTIVITVSVQFILQSPDIQYTWSLTAVNPNGDDTCAECDKSKE